MEFPVIEEEIEPKTENELLPCVFCCQMTPLNLAKNVYVFSLKTKTVCKALHVSDPWLVQNLHKVPYCSNCISIIRDVSELKKRIDNLKSQFDLKTTMILKLLRNQYDIDKLDEERLCPKILPSELRNRLITELKAVRSASFQFNIATTTENIPDGNEQEAFRENEIPESLPEHECEQYSDAEIEVAEDTKPSAAENRDESGQITCNIPENIVIRDCFICLARLSQDQIATKRANIIKSKKRKNLKNSKYPVVCTYVINTVYNPKSKSTRKQPCLRKFVTEEEMQAHYQKVHINNEDEKQCPHCFRQFSTFFRMKKHLLVHTRPRDFTCKSKRLSKPKRRKNPKNSKYPVVCKYVVNNPQPNSTKKQLCLRKFVTEEEMQAHYEKVHINNEDETQCPYCSRQFSAVFKLKKHLLLHTRQKDSSHKSRRKNPEDTKYPVVCKYLVNPQSESVRKRFCSRRFTTEGDMQAHYQRVHINNQDEKQCEYCSRQFTSLLGLKKHLLLHTGQGNFTCDLCGENFRTPYLFTKHRVTSHNEPHPYICDICNEGFYMPTRLTYHSFVHTGNWPLKCADCDFGCAIRSQMDKHRFFNHFEKGAPPISCSVCDKIFKSQAQLNQHHRMHIVDRPHKCSLCEKSFKTKGQVSMHEKDVHVTERKFLCQLCGDSFKADKHLLKHMRCRHPTVEHNNIAKKRRKKQKSSSSPVPLPDSNNPEDPQILINTTSGPLTITQDTMVIIDSDLLQLLGTGTIN